MSHLLYSAHFPESQAHKLDVLVDELRNQESKRSLLEMIEHFPPLYLYVLSTMAAGFNTSDRIPCINIEKLSDAEAHVVIGLGSYTPFKQVQHTAVLLSLLAPQISNKICYPPYCIMLKSPKQSSYLSAESR